MRRLVVSLLAVVLSVGGCAFTGSLVPSPPPSAAMASTAPSPEPPPTPRRTPRATPIPQPTAPGGPQTLALEVRDRTPVTPQRDVDATVKVNTRFALDLYQRVRRTEDGDIAMGPYSISVAFAMQDAGAQGRTARQIEQVLHFTLPTDRLDAAFNRLSLRLASRENRQLTLSLANRLFAAQLLPIRKAYRREITRHFDAPLAAVDFRGQPEAARKLINAWVSEQTAKRITELIPRKQITRSTMLVLVNAIYLKARWASQFRPQDTYDGRFTRLDGTRVKVPTMGQRAFLPVAVTDAYTAVELPYRGDKLAMLVVMPTAGTFSRFERALDPAVLSRVIGKLDAHGTRLSLPRFSIRTRLMLADTLEQMGIEDAFDRQVADFYGIADVPWGSSPRLYISKVIHQAFIRVGEKGTEAAAATAITDEGATGGDEGIIVATIDHPFLWFIRDRVTGTVLFMGRVVDPRDTTR